jgi:hypothetical protein
VKVKERGSKGTKKLSERKGTGSEMESEIESDSECDSETDSETEMRTRDIELRSRTRRRGRGFRCSGDELDF